MIISDAGKELIMRFEGCSLKPYKCPAGKWTIGYGHTDPHGYVEKLAQQQGSITQHQAEEILALDLSKFEDAVRELCPTANANQHSAMVCLAFNIGITRFSNSTLRRKFNAGDIQGAADEFPKWCSAGGVQLPGLVKRRAAERALFLTAVS